MEEFPLAKAEILVECRLLTPSLCTVARLFYLFSRYSYCSRTSAGAYLRIQCTNEFKDTFYHCLYFCLLLLGLSPGVYLRSCCVSTLELDYFNSLAVSCSETSTLSCAIKQANLFLKKQVITLPQSRSGVCLEASVFISCH